MDSFQNMAKWGSTSLSLARQVEPDLEQLERVGTGSIEQREHLRMHDSAAGGQPLHVAAAEASRRAQRIGMVDQPTPHDGHGLETAVRVGRETGHDFAVVHAPAVFALEVLPQVAPGERSRWTEPLVASRVVVVMVGAEEKRIRGFPRKAELLHADDGIRSHVTPSLLEMPVPTRGFLVPRQGRPMLTSVQ